MSIHGAEIRAVNEASASNLVSPKKILADKQTERDAEVDCTECDCRMVV
jgi:hypothetical protein